MPTSRIIKLLLVLTAWLFAGLAAQAATVVVVLSDDSAAYQEASEAIEREIGDGHKIVRVMADRLGVEPALSEARLVLGVGVKATEQIAGRVGKTPVLAVLVPKDWYQKIGRALLVEGARSAGAVVLDQPYSRQLQLIKAALPKVSRVGVVVSQSNAGQLAEVEQAARALRLSVSAVTIDSDSLLVESLERILSDSDVLLAIPDPLVLNRNTVQSLFITSYRYRDPVVGYSKSLSRAGALVSLYSTPAQIGRQAGEITQRFLSGGKLPGMQWPKYFSISLNTHVARSLDIDLISEQSLLRELQEGGGND